MEAGGRTEAAGNGSSLYVPSVHFDCTHADHVPSPAAAADVIAALGRSGFFLLESPLLPPELLARALAASQTALTAPDATSIYGVVVHPSDPKTYAMLGRADLVRLASEAPDGGAPATQLLAYLDTLEVVKCHVLAAIATGLGARADFFVQKHKQDNNMLRLIRYMPMPCGSSGDAGEAAATIGNRCKEHSDYGSLTFLLTDVLAGLEVFDASTRMWEPVPFGHDRPAGSVVVNIGSLMEGWCRGEIKATLHRVAGPGSLRSNSPIAALREASATDRFSLACFMDPDADVKLRDDDPSASLAVVAGDAGCVSTADYLAWRCGEGDGVAFVSAQEAGRLQFGCDRGGEAK
eukprot:COSAG02_NODE_263_length_26627_cov_47.198168_10_plen_349_part_00